MFVTSINVRREGYYGSNYGKADPKKPFNATIELHGQHGKVELNLSQDMSQRIVAILADEIAAAGKATAEALTSNFLEAAPALEQVA